MFWELTKKNGKHYATEHNPHRSGAWPELHIFDTVEERDEFIEHQRDAKSLSRADKVEMTQRGEKHWFERKAVSEKDAFKYIDKLRDRGEPGRGCIISHHRIDADMLAKMRDEAYGAVSIEQKMDLVETVEFEESEASIEAAQPQS